MADGYWNRQPTLHPSAGLLKRPRSDYELPSSVVPSTHEMHNYLARDDDRGGPRVVKDAKAIGSAYEHFLQNKITSFSSGETSNFGGVGLGRMAGGGASGLSLTDPVAIGRSAAVGPDLTLNGRGMLFDGRLPMEALSSRGMGFDGRLPMDALGGRGMGLDGRLPMDAVSDRGIGLDGRLPMDAMPRPTRETLPLPPDASKTVYVEGLPPNSTRREVAHIFRPFVGYKEVRLVSKESKHRGGDPLILCFVDFTDPACAATALSALQGYKMDEHDPDSAYLRLQFSKFPGPRSASGSRRKR